MTLLINLKLLQFTPFFIILFFTHVVPTKGASILFFFPAGSFSHKQSIWPMVTALADKGHNVTFLSGYEKRPYDHPKVNDLKSSSCEGLMNSVYGRDRVDDRHKGTELKLWDIYNSETIRICQFIFDNSWPNSTNDDDYDPVLRHVIHEAHYDLVINNLVLGDCGLILAYQKKAKLIISLSTPWYSFLHDEFGFPSESAWIPDMTTEYTFPMGFMDRVRNYILPIKWYYKRQWELYPALEEIMKEVYELMDEEVPSLLQVQQNASLIFSLAHFSTDFARSLPPMVINIGGMQCWMPMKPLDEKFKDILDKATEGAILIAFGSSINLATIPQRFKDIFLNMMINFPQMTFIWQWDGPPPPNTPKNLIVSKWLPQFQILSHPNLKGFISHAGLNSLTEATFHAVPVILLPLFADQDYNGYRVDAMETGIRLEIRDLNTEILIHSVNEILENPKYNKNMNTMSSLMKDRPMNPIETAVYWTEFVLRHDDTSSLKPLQNQSWFVRRQLDIIVFFVIVCSILLISILFCLLVLKRYLESGCKISKDPIAKIKMN